MKHLDLFSGIGGFALAAQWNGLETVAFCEIEPFAKRILNKNFPNIPIHNDVRNTADFSKYEGKIHLLTGGYPCQPFSVAGKQKGAEDDRHLWPAMLEIIKCIRPTWVLAENVGGHVKLGLDQVLADLEAEGYAARAVIIPACAVHASHRRDRVWIIANTAQNETATRQNIGLNASNSWSERGQGEFEEAFRRKPCLSWGKNCRSLEDWRGLPDLLQPLLSGGSNGIPDRVDRTRGLGNAIVPQVAAEIINAIVSTQEN